jgi:POT family proton-dependent oligopeptide transporter
MALATFMFWKGRHLYVVQAPTPFKQYWRELIEAENRVATLRVLLLFAVLSVFWALFDQTGSSWVLQAEQMNRVIQLPFGISFEVLPSQIQALNPILILVLAPLCTWGVYPVLSRLGIISTQGKIATGMVCAAIAFGIVGYAQGSIVVGNTPSVWWQLWAYVILTVAEVVVSITALELAYTSAPSTRRSLVTSFYLLSVSLGNGLTALVAGPLSGMVGAPSTPRFFYFFSGLSLLAVLPVWRVLKRIPQSQLER